MAVCRNEQTGALATIREDELPILAPFGWAPVDVPPAGGDEQENQAADDGRPDSEKE